jgi:hypothetical protein
VVVRQPVPVKAAAAASALGSRSGRVWA